MGDLTANFDLAEFLVGVPTTELPPPDSVLAAIRRLAVIVVQPIRDLAQSPVVVDDGWRPAAENAAVGGVAHSQHLDGEAADLRCPAMDLTDFFNLVRTSTVPYDQLILEPPTAPGKTGCVHVSCQKWTEDQPRRQALIRSGTPPWTYSTPED